MKWHFWIDRGGTFTDVVARTPAGTIVTAKLLSHDPEHYEDAAVEAVRRLMAYLCSGKARVKPSATSMASAICGGTWHGSISLGNTSAAGITLVPMPSSRDDFA
ncbi:hydantoinase/oxoprolinase N-terminal domain-containing protein [Defluviicoccus vanus]|uniref:Hydantoinase/oxoprolinase N-terminal domain-containing protein n=1 Tax=Defluviicoccus vanus TaxID=111831 RepID=A0A7H1MZG8_9PROT|nr:hypothetical protein HQ394_05150 [Defluviicoccus vanus]